MTKLYLHIGTNKTGSSFLQTLFARNRENLARQGFFFPISQNEKQMLSGRISPGNGQELTNALFADDKVKIKEILSKAYTEAKNQNCDSVLISNEVLIRSFADENALKTLVEISKGIGYSEIKCLGFIRDPVSHALSLYRHRAKNGDHLDLSIWLKTDYETMKIFEQFVINMKKFQIDWVFRRYFNDSDKMAQATFVDWLKIEKPAIPKDDSVNTSLAISELAVLQNIKPELNEAVYYLQKEFYKLKNSEKADESKLLSNRKIIIYNYLTQYSKLIEDLNQLMPRDEKLDFKMPLGDNEGQNVQLDEYTFTKSQIAAIAKGLNSFHKSNNGFRYIIKEMKAFGRKMKAKL